MPVNYAASETGSLGPSRQRYHTLHRNTPYARPRKPLPGLGKRSQSSTSVSGPSHPDPGNKSGPRPEKRSTSGNADLTRSTSGSGLGSLLKGLVSKPLGWLGVGAKTDEGGEGQKKEDEESAIGNGTTGMNGSAVPGGFRAGSMGPPTSGTPRIASTSSNGSYPGSGSLYVGNGGLTPSASYGSAVRRIPSQTSSLSQSFTASDLANGTSNGPIFGSSSVTNDPFKSHLRTSRSTLQIGPGSVSGSRAGSVSGRPFAPSPSPSSSRFNLNVNASPGPGLVLGGGMDRRSVSPFRSIAHSQSAFALGSHPSQSHLNDWNGARRSPSVASMDRMSMSGYSGRTPQRSPAPGRVFSNASRQGSATPSQGLVLGDPSAGPGRLFGEGGLGVPSTSSRDLNLGTPQRQSPYRANGAVGSRIFSAENGAEEDRIEDLQEEEYGGIGRKRSRSAMSISPVRPSFGIPSAPDSAYRASSAAALAARARRRDGSVYSNASGYGSIRRREGSSMFLAGLSRPVDVNEDLLMDGTGEREGGSRPKKKQMVFDERFGYMAVDDLVREREALREKEKERIRDGVELGVPGFERYRDSVSRERERSRSVGRRSASAARGDEGAERIFRVLEGMHQDGDRKKGLRREASIHIPKIVSMDSDNDPLLAGLPLPPSASGPISDAEHRANLGLPPLPASTSKARLAEDHRAARVQREKKALKSDLLSSPPPSAKTGSRVTRSTSKRTLDTVSAVTSPDEKKSKASSSSKAKGKGKAKVQEPAMDEDDEEEELRGKKGRRAKSPLSEEESRGTRKSTRSSKAVEKTKGKAKASRAKSPTNRDDEQTSPPPPTSSLDSSPAPSQPRRLPSISSRTSLATTRKNGPQLLASRSGSYAVDAEDMLEEGDDGESQSNASPVQSTQASASVTPAPQSVSPPSKHTEAREAPKPVPLFPGLPSSTSSSPSLFGVKPVESSTTSNSLFNRLGAAPAPASQPEPTTTTASASVAPAFSFGGIKPIGSGPPTANSALGALPFDLKPPENKQFEIVKPTNNLFGGLPPKASTSEPEKPAVNGLPTPAASSTPFSFGAKPGPLAGETKPAEGSKPSLFPLATSGAPAASSPAPPLFGKPTDKPASSAAPLFSFANASTSAAASDAPVSAPAFSFGKPATSGSDTSDAPKPSFPPLFGGAASTSTAPSTSGPGAVSNLFGQSNGLTSTPQQASKPKRDADAMDDSPPPPELPKSAAGQVFSPTITAGSAPLFGNAVGAATSAAPPVFGGALPSSSPSSNPFNFGQQQQPHPPSNPFGAAAAATSTAPSFSFGQATTSAQSAPPANPFGAAGSTSSFGFGQTSQSATTSGAPTPFGGPSTSTPAFSFGVNSSRPATSGTAQPSSGFSFNTAPQPASSGFGGFGSTSIQPAVATPSSANPFNFGASSQTATPTAQPAQAFGNSTPGSFQFGASTPSAGGTFQFGAPAAAGGTGAFSFGGGSGAPAAPGSVPGTPSFGAGPGTAGVGFSMGVSGGEENKARQIRPMRRATRR